MNRNLKIYLILIASVFIGGAAFTYGALTAPSQHPVTRQAVSTVSPSPTTSPSPSVTPSPKVSEAPKKLSLSEQLVVELPTITSVLTTAYPKITTEYTINKGQLFDKGQWFGTTLTYKGSDTNNRDTLRVLLQKKGDKWTIRTTPPQLLLSTKEFPDVPKAILQSINKPISLPAGASNSPVVNVTE